MSYVQLDQSDSHSIRKARQSHDCVLYMKRVRDKLDQISNTLFVLLFSFLVQMMG
jgi:hypothetical protein